MHLFLTSKASFNIFIYIARCVAVYFSHSSISFASSQFFSLFLCSCSKGESSELSCTPWSEKESKRKERIAKVQKKKPELHMIIYCRVVYVYVFMIFFYFALICTRWKFLHVDWEKKNKFSYIQKMNFSIIANTHIHSILYAFFITSLTKEHISCVVSKVYIN